MNILLLIGNHPRHIFFANNIILCFKNVVTVQVVRENFIPISNNIENLKDRENFRLHFENRAKAEKKYFNENRLLEAETYLTSQIEFEASVIRLLDKNKFDVAIVFGTNLISKNLLDALPQLTLNLHLGLSPQYKGSATLFWPFYMLEPNHAGFTFHKVTSKIDAGPVVAQGIPNLDLSDGIHDVACKVVLKASEEILGLLKLVQSQGYLFGLKQIKTGKLWREIDFRPEHLRINYDHFDDRMVASFLKKEIFSDSPKLVIQSEMDLASSSALKINNFENFW